MPADIQRQIAEVTRQTIGAALCRGGEALRRAGIDGARLEARRLLSHALGRSPESLLRNCNEIVSIDRFDALLARRVAREPLALIIGHRDFWTLRLAVLPVTLVPRPDSETLIEAALAVFPDRAEVRRVLDLGTGTGALLLAALSEFPAAFGVGVDCDMRAARLAADNAATTGLGDRAGFLSADWTASLAGRFDLILCNPPYVPCAEIDTLMPEVARFEPRSALDGGSDGLAAFRAIIPELPRLLAAHGAAILELGAGQAAAVSRLAEATGLGATTRNDLAGIARALVLRALADG